MDDVSRLMTALGISFPYWTFQEGVAAMAGDAGSQPSASAPEAPGDAPPGFAPGDGDGGAQRPAS